MTATAWVFIDDAQINKEYHLPTPEMRSRLSGLLSPVQFYFCQTTKGELFVWPIAAAAPGVRRNTNKWSKSADKAARLARGVWMSIVAGDGKYTLWRDKTKRQDPDWPDLTMLEVLGRAFDAEHRISSEEHWVIKEHGHRVAVTDEEE